MWTERRAAALSLVVVIFVPTALILLFWFFQNPPLQSECWGAGEEPGYLESINRYESLAVPLHLVSALICIGTLGVLSSARGKGQVGPPTAIALILVSVLIFLWVYLRHLLFSLEWPAFLVLLPLAVIGASPAAALAILATLAVGLVVGAVSGRDERPSTRVASAGVWALLLLWLPASLTFVHLPGDVPSIC